LPLPATPKARAVPARPKSVASHRKGGIERDLWIGWVEPVCGEDVKCQVRRAARPVPLPAGRHYWGREIPSFLIFSCKVERFIPRRAAWAAALLRTFGASPRPRDAYGLRACVAHHVKA